MTRLRLALWIWRVMGKLAALKKALDMSKEARMERAREMGFDTDQAYYHGTASDFDEFSIPDDGRFSLYGRGVYFARDPSKVRFAEQDGGNVIPAHIRGKMGTEADRLDAERALGPQLAGMGHGPRSELINSEMRSRGFAGYHSGDQAVAFDPSSIRSVNAAFDPAKKDSSNLLAGSAATAVGAGALMQGEEAEASFIGAGSKLFDQIAQGFATKMADAGMPEKEIFEKTGLFKGADGRWRQELDDSQMRLNEDAPQFGQFGIRTAQGDELIEGSDIGQAYPGMLENTTVSFNPELKGRGSLSVIPASEKMGHDDFFSLQVKDSAAMGSTRDAKVEAYERALEDAAAPESVDTIMRLYGLNRDQALVQQQENIEDLKQFIAVNYLVPAPYTLQYHLIQKLHIFYHQEPVLVLHWLLLST